MNSENLAGTFPCFHDHWRPRVVGERNGQHVTVVKSVGEFVWHKHDQEDELLLVVSGRFGMEFQDRAAGIDLALRILARHHGEEIARATAQSMESPYPEDDRRRVSATAGLVSDRDGDAESPRGDGSGSGAAGTGGRR